MGVVAFSPVSLPGLVADHILLGVLCIVVWLWIGSGPSLVRWSAVALCLALIVLHIARMWPLLLLVFVLADLTEEPFRTLDLECGRVVEMRRYGWVAHSGTEVAVLTRPLGGLFEAERGRQRFDDSQYVPKRLSAETAHGDTGCAVSVTYDAREVWRVR
jgi:hypothetical protein